MFGKRFDQELEMIKTALVSEQGELEMRKTITPYLNDVVEKYINDMKIIDYSKDELVRAAWTYFSVALKKYNERAQLMLEGKNNIYYFNTYFNWYIRQGIINHMKSAKNR